MPLPSQALRLSPEDAKKARVAAAIAKAKAKKQAQAASPDALSSDNVQSSAKTAPSRSPEDEKKARVAAAIAKAKAKKQGKNADNKPTQGNTQEGSE